MILFLFQAANARQDKAGKKKKNLQENESYQYLSFGPLTKVSTKLVQIYPHFYGKKRFP